MERTEFFFEGKIRLLSAIEIERNGKRERDRGKEAGRKFNKKKKEKRRRENLIE